MFSLDNNNNSNSLYYIFFYVTNLKKEPSSHLLVAGNDHYPFTIFINLLFILYQENIRQAILTLRDFSSHISTADETKKFQNGQQ